MKTLNEVIKAFDWCINNDSYECDECPYDKEEEGCHHRNLDALYYMREYQKLKIELEQKKGKWIDEKINSYTSRTYCSECGISAPFICVSGNHYGRNMHGETNKTKFCPNCGADMRGD